ncbi:MAG: acetoacetate decarboxylase family protein [Ferrovibrionaceae bacterium]
MLRPFDDDHTLYSMPPFFGGTPYPPPALRYADTLSLTIAYATEAAALTRLLPPGFSLLRPEILVSCINNRGVEWMAGSPYNLVAVNVPVRFEGSVDRLDGVFGLAVWENKTTPIIAGREMLGVPKVFAEIEPLREFPAGETHSWSHYEGRRFLDIGLTAGRAADGDEIALLQAGLERVNWFGWRYLPKVGAPGAAVSEPVVCPQDFTVREAWFGQAVLEWLPPDPRHNPTQAHVIAGLAALPNLGFVGAVMTRSETLLRADLARVPH